MTENNSEQFSLRWNNFHSNLSTGFHAFLQGEDLVDVTLAAGGQFVQAHKLVLSVCSPYFKNLFKVNPCKHPIVILKDVGQKELVHILEFMYRGEVNVRQDDLTDFLKTAEMLQVKGLTGEDTPANSSATQESGKQANTSPVPVKTEAATPTRPAKRARTSAPLPLQSSPTVSPLPVRSASPAISVASSLTNDSQQELDFIDLAKTKEEPVDYDSDVDKADEHPAGVHSEEESFTSNMHKTEDVTSFVSDFHKNEDSFMHLLGSGENSRHHDSSLGTPGIFGNFPQMTGSLVHDSGGSSQDGGQVWRQLQHQSAHRAQKAVCPACFRTFTNKYNLKIHFRDVHSLEPRLFTCGQCGKALRNRSCLRMHIYRYHALKRASKEHVSAPSSSKKNVSTGSLH